MLYLGSRTAYFPIFFLLAMSLLPSSVAVVDPTVYPDDAIPELPLRQVLHSAGVPAECN